MITKYVKQIIGKNNFLTVLPIFTPSLYTNAFKALKTTSKIPPKVSCGKPKHRSI